MSVDAAELGVGVEVELEAAAAAAAAAEAEAAEERRRLRVAAPPPPAQDPVIFHTPRGGEEFADEDEDEADVKEEAELFRIPLTGNMVISTKNEPIAECVIQRTHVNKYMWLTPTILSIHLPGKNGIATFRQILDKLIRDGKFVGQNITIQGDFNCDLADESERRTFLTALHERDLLITDLYTPSARVNKERSKNPCENSQVGKAGTPTITAKDAAVTVSIATPVEKMTIALLKELPDPRQQQAVVTGMGEMGVRVQAHLRHIRTLEGLIDLPVAQFPGVGRDALMKDHLASYSLIQDAQGTVFGIAVTDNVIKSKLEVNDLYDANNETAVQAASKRLGDFQWRYLARTLLTEEQRTAIFGELNIDRVEFNTDERDHVMYTDPLNAGEEISGIALRTRLEKAINDRWLQMFPATQREDGAENRAANIAKQSAECKVIAEAFYTASYASAEFGEYNGLLNRDKQYNDAMKADVKARNTGAKGIDGALETPLKMMNYFFMGGLRQPDNMVQPPCVSPESFIYPLNVQPFGGFTLPEGVNTQEGIDKRQVADMLAQYQEDIGAGRLRNGTPILIMNLKECGADTHSELFYKLVEKIMRLSATGLENLNFEQHVLRPVEEAMAQAAREAEAKRTIRLGFDVAIRDLLRAQYAPNAPDVSAPAQDWAAIRAAFLITEEDYKALLNKKRMPERFESLVEDLVTGEVSMKMAAKMYVAVIEDSLVKHKVAAQRRHAESARHAVALTTVRRTLETEVLQTMGRVYAPDARHESEVEDGIMDHFLINARQLTVLRNGLTSYFNRLVEEIVSGEEMEDARDRYVERLTGVLNAHRDQVLLGQRLNESRMRDALEDAVDLRMEEIYAPHAVDREEADRVFMAHFLINEDQRASIDVALTEERESLVRNLVGGLIGMDDARDSLVADFEAALVAHKAEVEERLARQRAEALAAVAAAEVAAAAQRQQAAAAEAVVKPSVLIRRF